LLSVFLPRQAFRDESARRGAYRPGFPFWMLIQARTDTKRPANASYSTITGDAPQ
jgi:hypothetical protein